jgi:HSP20 family protein
MPWRSADTDPFLAMRREMNRLFDDAFGGFGLPSLFGPVMGRMPAEMVVPQMDVSETERELQITAEVPGIDAKDIEVLLADDPADDPRRDESGPRRERAQLSCDGV